MFEALGVSGWNIRLIKIANYGIGTSFTIEWSDEEDAWMTDEFGETEKAVCTRGFGPDPIETEMRLFDAEAQDFFLREAKEIAEWCNDGVCCTIEPKGEDSPNLEIRRTLVNGKMYARMDVPGVTHRRRRTAGTRIFERSD